jgi:hypothetical protein
VEKSVVIVMSWYECRGSCNAKEGLMSQIVAADNKRRAGLTEASTRAASSRCGSYSGTRLGPPLGLQLPNAALQPDDCCAEF